MPVRAYHHGLTAKPVWHDGEARRGDVPLASFLEEHASIIRVCDAVSIPRPSSLPPPAALPLVPPSLRVPPSRFAC